MRFVMKCAVNFKALMRNCAEPLVSSKVQHWHTCFRSAAILCNPHFFSEDFADCSNPHAVFCKMTTFQIINDL